MSKNIGWSKKVAEAKARDYRKAYTIDAYAQREEHLSFDVKKHSHQWIVILQKKPKP